MSLFADFISLIGLALLGYGLFLFDPRVAYCVVGVLLIVAGYRISGNIKPVEVADGLDG